MPFVQRCVEPKFLSRTNLFDEDGNPKVVDDELQAVTNNTLCNALRQLASLVLAADNIFQELGGVLQGIYKRSDTLQVKIGVLEEKILKFNPKEVTVPESDIATFALLKNHYHAPQQLDTSLFSVETRPSALRILYDSSSKTPIHAMRQLDRCRRDGRRSSGFFLCTPVLGAKRRKIRTGIDIEIETSMPAAVEELRRWTSDEALGDITVTPDCANRIPANLTATDGNTTDGTVASDDEGIDHKLPSPEEQLQVVALRFPAEIVAVDISGRSFDRMSIQRRSLMHGEIINQTTDGDPNSARRKTRSRKPRNRRRNTLAGTDHKEIREALTAGEEPASPTINHQTASTSVGVVCRSKSSDPLRSSSKKESPENKKSHFNTLKAWGKSRYDKLMNKSTESKTETTKPKDDIDDFNVYETVTMKRKRDLEKERKTHERNSSISSSEKSSINMPVSNTLSSVMNIAVKLRESSAQRRQRRSGGNKDEPHSSSGNWSASSESGRASIGSEITSTTHPKSTTSAATSSNSLNQPSSVNSRRRFNVNTSTSGSVTSEGTLTPDIIHDLHEDGETSSVYSCDTEGYYTSFHMDSGLKTLKEEDTPPTPIHSTTAFSNSGSNNTVLSAENEYELFGKGSTSTTTSSAGTVCTTLRAAESNKSLVVGPAVPERKSSLSKLSNKSAESSLERDSSDKTGTVKRSPATNSKPTVVALIHKQTDGDISPDSGHNTSSSPIESINSPNGVRSGSDFEFSESSDMEGPERIERIRVKTTINSSRIPSMCVITPPHSDDESENSSNSSKNTYQKQLEEKNAFNQSIALYKKGEKGKGEQADEQSAKNLPRIISTTVTGSNKLSLISVNPQSGYATVQTIDQPDGSVQPAENDAKEGNDNITTIPKSFRAPSPSGGTVTIKNEPPTTKTSPSTQPIIRASLLPLNNMFGRLKSNLTSFAQKRDRSKSPNTKKEQQNVLDEGIFDSGEYVTIADVRNNNEKALVTNQTATYANDMINKNLSTVLSGKDMEYVSLNDLPSVENNITSTNADSLERKRQGARVMLDAEGKVVYSSDSLRRRKGAHTTFEPGPHVKPANSPSPSPLPVHRVPKAVRPVQNTHNQLSVSPHPENNRPLSPQIGKLVIKASSGMTSPTAEIVRMPPSKIVAPSMRSMSPKPVTTRGAYVHIQEAGNVLAAQEKEGVPPSATSSVHGNLEYSPTNLKEMYHYGESVLDSTMDTNRYLSSQYYLQKGSSMYSTLPSKRTPFFGNETVERSVTPDITRGLERNYNYGMDNTQHSLPRNMNRPELNQNLGIPVQMPDINRLSLQHMPFEHTPTYRQPNYASIPSFSQMSDDYPMKISPIDPRHSVSFHSSTPSKADLKAAVNLESKLLSPKKSTMSTEELYAVIHKSKKKMNIETDEDHRQSPVTVLQESPQKQTMKSPETGYLADKSRSRLSWSPSKGEYVDFNPDIDKLSPPNDSRSRQSWACSDRNPKPKQTSTIDFKRLLLQKSSGTTPKKISAVEQLKISKEQIKPAQPKPGQSDMTILDLSGSPRSLVNRRFLNNLPGSPNREPKPAAKILSPRAQWRFANPRSDVLSSTILEDCREDESPNNSGERRKSSPRSGKGSPKSDSGSPKPGNSSPKFTNVSPKSSTATIVKPETSPKGMPRNMIENKPYSSATQRLYARRAQFFSPVSTRSQIKSTEEREKQQSPPTLETAF